MTKTDIYGICQIILVNLFSGIPILHLIIVFYQLHSFKPAHLRESSLGLATRYARIHGFYQYAINYISGSRGGGAGVSGLTPMKNHKNIGFLNNTGPDPLKNHKATKPAFNVGPSAASQQSDI